jgi:hypothetical protein
LVSDEHEIADEHLRRVRAGGAAAPPAGQTPTTPAGTGSKATPATPVGSGVAPLRVSPVGILAGIVVAAVYAVSAV